MVAAKKQSKCEVGDKAVEVSTDKTTWTEADPKEVDECTEAKMKTYCDAHTGTTAFV